MFGFLLAVLVGITLGLIGSGGSILAVPIMVYVFGINPVLATAYSLFIVGTSALVGGFKKAKQNLVNFKMVFVFGLPTILMLFATRKFIVPFIPDIIYINDFEFAKPLLLLILFAIVMIMASFSMIKPNNDKLTTNENVYKLNYLIILLVGISIGFIAGLVGAGGGFLIVPSLVLLARLPIKTAVGTSLFIIAFQSLIGFGADLWVQNFIDWPFLLIFSSLSIIGIFIGHFFSKTIDSNKLKVSFGWFVLTIGVLIIIKELVF